MTLTRKALLGLTAAASIITLAGASASMAQPPGGLEGRRGPPPGAEGRERGPMGPEQRAEQLRTRLSITPAQENAFQAFLAATARPERGERPGRAAMEGMTAPQRLDAQLAEAAARQADMKSRAEAAKRFYAALSTTQRAAFDALPPQAMLGMGGGRGGGDRMAMRGGARGERGNRGQGGPGTYQPQ